VLGRFSLELLLLNTIYPTITIATTANKATINITFLLLLFFLRGLRLRDLLGLISNGYGIQ
jgi:hypothetical protein